MNESVLSFDDVNFHGAHAPSDDMLDIPLNLDEEKRTEIAPGSTADAVRLLSSPNAPYSTPQGLPVVQMKNVFATVREAREHVSKRTGEKAVYYLVEVVATYDAPISGVIGQDGDISIPDCHQVEQKSLTWSVYHRFSDFDLLHSTLAAQSSLLPPLPSKTWWPSFSNNFISKRRVELNDYLMKLMEIPYVRNSYEMVEFLEARKHINVDTSAVPRVTKIVTDRNFGVNAHIFDASRGLLITACEDSDLMSRLDSQLSNIQLPWEDKATTSVVPLGSLNCWLYEAETDNWVPTTTLFFEHQVSALAFDSRRGHIWVGLHSGRVICYRCSRDYAELDILYECTLHTHRVGAMHYDPVDDIVLCVGRDSLIHVLHFGAEHGSESTVPTSIVADVPVTTTSTFTSTSTSTSTGTGTGTGPSREHIFLTSLDAEEGWLGSVTYDPNHKLAYVGCFSGKVFVYHLSQRVSGSRNPLLFYMTDSDSPNSYNNGSLYSPKQQDASGIIKTNSPISHSRYALTLSHMITGHSDCVRSLYLCPTTHYLATAGFDYQTGVWCLRAKDGSSPVSPSSLHNIYGNATHAASPVSMGGGSGVGVGVGNNIINLGWLRGGPREKIKAVCVCSEVNIIVTGLDNGTIALWDTRSGQLMYILNAHKNSVVSLQWIPERVMLISAARDGKVKFWHMQPVQ